MIKFIKKLIEKMISIYCRNIFVINSYNMCEQPDIFFGVYEDEIGDLSKYVFLCSQKKHFMKIDYEIVRPFIILKCRKCSEIYITDFECNTMLDCDEIDEIEKYVSINDNISHEVESKIKNYLDEQEGDDDSDDECYHMVNHPTVLGNVKIMKIIALSEDKKFANVIHCGDNEYNLSKYIVDIKGKIYVKCQDDEQMEHVEIISHKIT
jgi:hypothetical protein